MNRQLCLRKTLAVMGVVAGASLFVYGARSIESCRSCFAGRAVSSWGICWPSAPGSPLWTIGQSTKLDSPSIAQREIFDSTHIHQWERWSGSAESLFANVIGCGPPPWNRFLWEYNGDDGFRAFIRTRIRDGLLSKEDAQRLAEFREPPLAGPAPEERRLLILGRALFNDYFGDDGPQEWWWN